MAAADTARLIASLELKDQFSGPASKITRSLDKLDRGITSTQGRAFKAGQQIGTGIRNSALLAAGGIGILATQVGFGLRALTELETVTTQTNAVLKSTKGVSGQTAESIRAMAESYENLNATIDDKVIQSAENVLLTFTAVNKVFKPAIQAALDMSTALGTDLQGSVIQIGKALQDPIKGITALRRVGVNFSADQVKVIKKLVETGQTLKAQKIILKELNTEFGGSFLAGGTTTAGKVAKFKDAIEDLQKTLATALLPVIGKVADGLQKFLADPRVIKGAKDLGDSIAGLFSDKNLAAGADFLKGAFQTAKEAAPIVRDAAKATFGLVQAAVGVFKSLPPEIQKLAIGAFAINKLTGGLVTNLAGGLISAVISSFKGLMNVNAAVVTVNGPVGGIGATGAVGGASRLGQAASLISKVFVVGMVAEVADLIHGAISPGGGLEGRTASGQLLPADQLSWPFGPKNTPKVDLGPFKNIFGGDSAFVAPLSNAPNAVVAGGFDSRVTPAAGSRTKDDLVNLVQLGKATNDYLNDLYQIAVQGLKTAKSPAEIQKAVAAALAVVTKRGNATATGKVLADLKGQLVHTTDPETRRILKAAIDKVEHKLVGRQLVQKQLDKAEDIFKGTKSTKDKIVALTAIEQGLAHTSKSGQAKVAAEIASLRRSQKYEARATTEAIKDKDLSVTVNNKVTAAFTLRQVINGVTTYQRVGTVRVITP